MWSDIFWWSVVGVAVILVVRTMADLFANPAALPRDDQLEALIAAKHLQPGHYYLFIWDIRSMTYKMAADISVMLKMYGIDNSFVRTRPGMPPVVYDLKRPEQPVKGSN